MSSETFPTSTIGLLALNDWLSKLEVTDAEWLSKLLRCSPIESNFVQPEEIRDLGDLTRYRKRLIHHRISERNRIHKILQDANIKLTSIFSDIFGVSSRRILEAIINGRIRHHHLDMLRYHWNHMAYLEKSIEELEN